MFFILFIPLEWWWHDTHEGQDFGKRFMDIMFPFALTVLIVGAVDAESYPDRLARSFTTITSNGNGIYIRALWLSATLSMGPAVPLMLCCSYVGIFDHSFIPDYVSKFKSYLLGYSAAAILFLGIILMCLGFHCTVNKNYVRWVTNFLGIDFRGKEYKNARLFEYALYNGGGGGPVVTIEYEDSDGKRKMKKLKFRNLYKCSREEFGDILAEYLGQPERITEIPTRKGHQLRLVEDESSENK